MKEKPAVKIGRVELSSRALYVLVGVLLILGAFYWFELRPELIRKRCARQAHYWGGTSYDMCLLEAGMQVEYR